MSERLETAAARNGKNNADMRTYTATIRAAGLAKLYPSRPKPGDIEARRAEIPDGILDRANAIWEASLADGTPDAVTIIAKALLAAEKRGEERERAKLNAIIDMWKRRDHLSLHSGEVTAQEFRTVVAVLNAIAAAIRKGSD